MNDHASNADQRLRDAVIALRRACAGPVVMGPLEPVGGWNVLTLNTIDGYVVIVSERHHDAGVFWGGPPAPDARVSALRYRDPLTDELRVSPVAVFTSPAAARAAYLKYWNHRTLCGLPIPAIMRVVSLETINETGDVPPLHTIQTDGSNADGRT